MTAMTNQNTTPAAGAAPANTEGVIRQARETRVRAAERDPFGAASGTERRVLEVRAEIDSAAFREQRRADVETRVGRVGVLVCRAGKLGQFDYHFFIWFHFTNRDLPKSKSRTPLFNY